MVIKTLTSCEVCTSFMLNPLCKLNAFTENKERKKALAVKIKYGIVINSMQTEHGSKPVVDENSIVVLL